MRRFGQPASGGGGGGGPLAASILAKLTSWWEMDENSGSRLDSKGINNLTVNGTVSTATGVRGAGDVAAAFAGFGALTIASNTSIQVPSGGGDHCIFGWVYLTSNIGAEFFVAKTNASGSSSVEYAFSMQGEIYYAQNGGSSYYNASQSAPTAGTWNFVVMWRDASDGKVRMQINDGAVNVSASSSNPSPNTYDLAFGRNGSSPSEYLTGRLQRWGWIKGATLTADERAWLYNSGAGRTYAELTA